jgi:hypothetical protein
MKPKLAMTLVLVAALIMTTLATIATTRPVQAAPNDNDSPGPRWPIDGYPPSDSDNAILKWDEELLQTIRKYPSQTGPTVTSRAIGVLHTATYDAWAPYDATAVPTMANGNTRVTDASLRTDANKTRAISWAAYRVLRDLFPVSQYPNIDADIDYDGQMAELLGTSWQLDTSADRTIGENAAAAVIAYRHHDGANQLGDEPGTQPPGKPYADYTAYQPTRAWNEPTDPMRWQPLCTLTPAGVAAHAPVPTPTTTCTAPNYAVQTPLTPQWKNIRSFALTAPNQFTPPGPPKLNDGTQYDPAEIAQELADTSNLTDAKKMTAEYWADGPHSEFPPGHFAVIAQALSRKRGHSLDTDAKLFFVLGNAMLDAGVSAWSAKYKIGPDAASTFDFWRPITAIRYHYRGQMINSWKGPYQGFGLVPAEQWLPYQALNVITPPFPEYTSGHSTFSGAGRIAIIAFIGTDSFRAQVTIPAGSSLFEPRDATHAGTPAKNVVLSWKNLLDASDQAGMSRRYGGIHFYSGDMHGRANGASVGYWVYDKATRYFSGAEPPLPVPIP